MNIGSLDRDNIRLGCILAIVARFPAMNWCANVQVSYICMARGFKRGRAYIIGRELRVKCHWADNGMNLLPSLISYEKGS